MTPDENPPPPPKKPRKKKELPPPPDSLSREIRPPHPPPPIDPYLEYRPPLERSRETLRYSLEKLDGSGDIKSWFRLNGKVFLWILIPLLLFFVPLSYLTQLLFVITEDVIATYQNLREHSILFGFCGVVLLMIFLYLFRLFRR